MLDVQVLAQNQKQHEKQGQISPLITHHVIMASNENTFKNFQTEN